MTRLPRVLVIGAMKAGTTSFLSDLERHEQVYVPTVKEPHFLCGARYDEAATRRRYSLLYRFSRPRQVLVDGSTGYSKLPTIAGIPARARRLLGPEAKILYLVRHPVERALSHHYHLLRAGAAPADPDDAFAAIPELTWYSQYAMQLYAWLEQFGRRRVCVICFEDYVRDRPRTLAQVADFLHVSPFEDGPGDAIKNRGEDVQVVHGRAVARMKALTRNPLYKIFVHPYLRPAWRRALLRIVAKPPPPRPSPPSAATWHRFAAALRPDIDRLCEILTWQRCPWSLEPGDVPPNPGAGACSDP